MDFTEQGLSQVGSMIFNSIAIETLQQTAYITQMHLVCTSSVEIARVYKYLLLCYLLLFLCQL